MASPDNEKAHDDREFRSLVGRVTDLEAEIHNAQDIAEGNKGNGNLAFWVFVVGVLSGGYIGYKDGYDDGHRIGFEQGANAVATGIAEVNEEGLFRVHDQDARDRFVMAEAFNGMEVACGRQYLTAYDAAQTAVAKTPTAIFPTATATTHP